MQSVSNTYKALVAQKDHEFAIKMKLQSDTGFETIREDKIVSIETVRQTLSDFSYPIGNACAGECNIEILKPSYKVPRMAKIELSVAACGYLNSVYTESEFIPKGTFFIDTREKGQSGSASTMIIHGYDAMLKAEATFPSTSHQWPARMWDAVDDILPILGVTLDVRTQWVNIFDMPLPVGFSCREVLEYIAIMEGGNWVITDTNKLRLIQLNDLPEETNYLISHTGDRITFGGTRILLGGD